MKVLMVRVGSRALTSDLDKRVRATQAALEQGGHECKVLVCDSSMTAQKVEDRMDLYDAAIFFGYMPLGAFALAVAKAVPEKQFCLVTGAPCNDDRMDRTGLRDRPPNLRIERFPDNAITDSRRTAEATRIVNTLKQPA